MIDHEVSFGFGAEVARPFDETLHRTREALGAQGFGIVSDIDVAATLRAKLGEEIRPYVILGTCDPVLAHRAVAADPDVGLLLPCNVVVYDAGPSAAGGPPRTIVVAADPTATLPLARHPVLTPLAVLVASRLRRAVSLVAEPEAADAPAAPPLEVAEEIC